MGMLALTAVTVLAFGCGGGNPARDTDAAGAPTDAHGIADAGGDRSDTSGEAGAPQAGERGPLDVVFVVERNPAATGLQAALGASLEAFVKACSVRGSGACASSCLALTWGPIAGRTSICTEAAPG
jgi:hypothetical protein